MTKYIFFLAVTIFCFSNCNSRTKDQQNKAVITSVVNTTCNLDVNAKVIDSIVTLYHAKALYDSVINCIYINYYNAKYCTQKKDSVSLLALKIRPHTIDDIIDTPFAIGIVFYITDGTCNYYYDSLYRKNENAVVGYKFTTSDNKIFSFTTDTHKGIVDDSFMIIKKKIKDLTFIKAIKDNYGNLDTGFRAFLQREKVL